jgi:hypothetical protein
LEDRQASSAVPVPRISWGWRALDLLSTWELSGPVKNPPAANYTDPSVYFLGGGVVESTPAFRDWFMGKVREHTVLRDEQTRLASFAVVPDLDMAGARGAALAALATLL